MLVTILLAIAIGVLALLLAGARRVPRSAAYPNRTGGASADSAAWMPVIFSDGDGTDCSAGDGGCDGGGGGGD